MSRLRKRDRNMDIDLSGWEGLANAVILCACEDYRSARKKLGRNRDNKMATAMARDCEKFFRSDWFGALSDVDGSFLLSELRRETA